MEKMQQRPQQPGELHVAVTIRETNLVSSIIYTALQHMNTLGDEQRKIATRFMVKLQKAALPPIYLANNPLNFLPVSIGWPPTHGGHPFFCVF
jgi:hypothetical protein